MSKENSAEKEYRAKDIQVLEGLEPVRKRPGMYIGTTGAKGMHHILWEIVDNSIDEVANGYGDTISIDIYPDNSISVKDNGRGIPVDIHPEKSAPRWSWCLPCCTRAVNSMRKSTTFRADCTAWARPWRTRYPRG